MSLSDVQAFSPRRLAVLNVLSLPINHPPTNSLFIFRNSHNTLNTTYHAAQQDCRTSHSPSLSYHISYTARYSSFSNSRRGMVRLRPNQRNSSKSPSCPQLTRDPIRFSRLVSLLTSQIAELINSCGYNVTNLALTSKVGCTYRGWEWGIPERYFGFPLPDEINQSVSRVSVMA